MIDTEKYEGTNWDLRGQFTHTEMADEVLLLLAEVKRLREWKAEVERICRTMNGPNRDTALFIMTNEVEEE